MPDSFDIQIATPERLLSSEKAVRAQIPAKDAVPATATTPAIPATAQSAQIAVRDGFIQEKKKAAPVHKPAAGHKPAAAH